MGWLNSQWEQIRGNFKYDLLRSLFTSAVGVTVLGLVVGFGQKLAHHPASTLELLLIPIVGGILMCCLAIFLSRPKPKINIEVTMDDGYSAYQWLTVTNKGDTSLFTAWCQIENSNRPENYPKGVFRLGWEDGTRPNEKISRFASAQILIASMKDVMPQSLLEMSICKLLGTSSEVQWWARWDVEGNDELPFFRLKVTVVAEGTRHPWVRTFTLTPRTRLGTFSMKPAEVDG